MSFRCLPGVAKGQRDLVKMLQDVWVLKLGHMEVQYLYASA